ncbi:MAG: ABC transporter ATP-binding protein [Thermomicrobiales bacterium]|nr:ABC transporter ATP-binding protein [Thermomicrobiales bacterium]
MNIEIRNIHQRFGDTIALNDLSLSIEGTKIIGLLGRNGSGKSTLLNIIAGFRKPTSGKVLMDGEPVFENGRITERLALIREVGDTVEDSEKVEEALRYAAYLRPNWNDERARYLLDRFEVSLKSKISSLSRGRRSALGIALGLAAQADLTMLDETYLGLDAPSRYLFYDELLQDYMNQPRTFILSSHLIEEIARFLEDIVIIDHGKLMFHGNTEQFVSQGAAVTGNAADVDRFVVGKKVIGERQLGRTKSAMVYGEINIGFLEQASTDGLDVESLGVQDLFVYLTQPKDE